MQSIELRQVVERASGERVTQNSAPTAIQLERLSLGRAVVGRLYPAQITYLHFKRVIDFLFASAAFMISLPVLVVACIVVMLDSSGAPIFTQRRIGAGGKPFKLYKIRTMYKNTENASCVTRSADPRITRVGNWLRGHKIDELPQLINIMKGDMSIIGPRPLSEVECKFIRKEGIKEDHPGFIPVRSPGLVGIEQLNRERGLSYKGRFALNAVYERHISLILDLQILIRSIVQCRILVYCVTLACIGELAILALYSTGIPLPLGSQDFALITNRVIGR